MKHKKAIIITPIVITFIIISSSFLVIRIIQLNSIHKFNILDFWDDEIVRVNNTPLNISLGENTSLIHTNAYTNIEYNFTVQDIQFDSPNYVDSETAILRIHGVLLYPENVKSSNPGCLAMHGYWESAVDAYRLAYPYLEKGFIVLCHSHPGYGGSDGPGIAVFPFHFNYKGEYNQESYHYLTLCATIQGLRVLENFSVVDNSHIMVTGHSLGALNAMWLAGIAGDRLMGVVSYCAMGDLRHMYFTDFLNESYWSNQALRLDPIYYLKSSKVPPILWQIGSDDEFFNYSSIKKTYEAVSHDEKFLQIYPNEIHKFEGFENNTQFFIDYLMNGGNSPPRLQLDDDLLTFQNSENKITINSFEVVSEVNMTFIQLYYEDSYWKAINLVSSGVGTWTGDFDSSENFKDYYIMVHLEGSNNTWFSSKIYSLPSKEGTPETLSPFLFVMLISMISIASIIIMIMRNKSINVRQA